jgi:thioredoxin reductase
MKVLVIGGGIGGLAAAVALRRKGFVADVYEAAPELRPVGKGIWVPTNAIRCSTGSASGTPLPRPGGRWCGSSCGPRPAAR